jgi:hypothetical protein
MRKMNRRGKVNFPVDEAGDLIISIPTAVTMIAIGFAFTLLVIYGTPDNLCLLNSQAAELFGWDTNLVDGAARINFLCNQWKDTKVIDIDLFRCDAFIDYDVATCPYLNDHCNDVQFRDLGGGCMERRVKAEGFANDKEGKEAFLLEFCEYESFCAEYLGEEADYPEKAKLAEKRYVAQQVGIYAERCVYMSAKNNEFIVPCFSLEVEGYGGDINKDFIINVSKYSESSYTKSETAEIPEKYYRFAQVYDDGEVESEADTNSGASSESYKMCRYEHNDEGIRGEASDVYHKKEAYFFVDTSDDIKIVWIPDDDWGDDREDGQFLGIVSYESSCKDEVEGFLEMDSKFRDDTGF